MLTLNKEQYINLRNTVRQNTLLNSREALLKRFTFCDTEVLMGGIVVKKTKLIEQQSGNKNLRLSCFVSEENIKEEAEGSVESLGLDRREDIKQIRFKVFDFSGTFIALGSFDKQDKNFRTRLFKIKEGDLLYIIGKIVPINSEEGYFFLPSTFFNDEEIKLYKEIHEEYFLKIDKAIKEIKRKKMEEYLGDIISCKKENMDVIRPFLQKNKQLNDYDYYWLVDVIYDMYLKRHSTKLAYLIAMYYKKYANNMEFEEESERVDSFFDLYPKLKGVVSESSIH